MDETITMTVPPPLPAKTQARDASQVARQTVSIRTVSPSVPTSLATVPGATVFVGVSAPTVDSATTCGNRIPEVQSANGGYEERSGVIESSRQQQHQQQQQQQQQSQHQQYKWWQQHNHSHHQQQQQQQQQAAHIVKIRINPDDDKNSRVISTVRLTLDGNSEHNREIENGNARERSVRHTGDRGAVLVSATNLVNERHRASAGTGDGCVRISVYSGDPPAAASDHDRERNSSNSSNNSSVSISGDGGGNDSDKRDQSDARSDNGDMVHRGTTETLNSSGLGGRTAACFYYNNSYQNPLSMVMSSGQCSPSETLDSGTCSDLDGTPPPLPKKKNASTVILSTGTHNRTGSLTSSGAEVDSDDNESNISCDSLNGAEANGDVSSEYRVHSRNEEDHVKATLLTRNTEKTTTTTTTTKTDVVEKFGRTTLANGASDQAEESEAGLHLDQVSAITETGSFSPTLSANVSRSPSDTSSLSKASSTPRVRSPDPATEQQNGKAVVKECTYEERKQHEHERTECTDADQNQSSGHKYLYEDDRYYNFHVNELREKSSNGEHGTAESDECFAGYKIHQKEAIRSAKGTVRGVKNRVRAGIATFLQTPTSKVCIRH